MSDVDIPVLGVDALVQPMLILITGSNKNPDIDVGPLLTEFFSKFQLTASVSISCTTQTKRINGHANFIV